MRINFTVDFTIVDQHRRTVYGYIHECIVLHHVYIVFQNKEVTVIIYSRKLFMTLATGLLPHSKRLDLDKRGFCL
jgi:hypothetical protein